MMNFEQFMSNVNKANEEIERLAAENEAMREDIDNEAERRLNVFKAKLKPLTDVFFSGKTPFRQMTLKTGISDGHDCEITIKIAAETQDMIIAKRNSASSAIGPRMINMGYIKEEGGRDRWYWYHCVVELLKNTDDVVANLEQDFARQITEYIDKKFLIVAKENDRAAAEWKEMYISDKPFYTENWMEEDIVNALEEAGKPVTRKTINELKSRFIVHLQMDGVVIRKELLDDLAQEVEA